MVEVSIVPFSVKHMDMLIEMLKSQEYLDITNITYKTLPKVGYIALLGSQPIAAGFLRRLEPCYAQLDGLTSNAYFGSEIRHRGVKAVVDALIEDAKRLKLQGILAISKDNGTLVRAQALGFRIIEQTLIGLPLE